MEGFDFDALDLMYNVTIIDNSSLSHSEYETEVKYEVLTLMMNSDSVTVRGKTLKKLESRVDEDGNVFFYGTII